MDGGELTSLSLSPSLTLFLSIQQRSSSDCRYKGGQVQVVLNNKNNNNSKYKNRSTADTSNVGT